MGNTLVAGSAGLRGCELKPKIRNNKKKKKKIAKKSWRRKIPNQKGGNQVFVGKGTICFWSEGKKPKKSTNPKPPGGRRAEQKVRREGRTPCTARKASQKWGNHDGCRVRGSWGEVSLRRQNKDTFLLNEEQMLRKTIPEKSARGGTQERMR